MTSRRVAMVGLLVLAFGLAPTAARAQPPTPELMAKLASQADALEKLRTRASYRVEGQLEQLDGDGRPSSVKRMKARVEPNGLEQLWYVDEYWEDGENKTAEAREKELERRAERRKKPKKPIRMPTHAEEQGRYRFDVVEADRADPARVMLSFKPREPDERTIEGTAWVDTRTGAVLSAGFKLAKTSMFVDYVHVKVRFGEDTPLGPAVSTVEFEGKGGILFLRKHFRGSAVLSGYRVVP